MSGIKISATKVEPIEIELIGKTYVITPPKTALAMRIAVEAKNFEEDPDAALASIQVWIDKAFGKKVGASVMARLEDDDDELDFPHLMNLMSAVVEYEADGDPTS